MFKAYPLGRLFGVEIRLHGTLILLVAAAVLFSLLAGGLGAAVETLAIVGMLAASVTLHELGHIMAARWFGIGTTGVTLYPFGGLARLTREAHTPAEEVVVALAGPAVNVFLAGLAAAPALLFDPLGLAHTFLVVNVALALFNLVPAYPMDGGRVLRGALWTRLGYTRATRWAARAGQGFAVAFGLLGLLYSPMLVVIAAFVFLQASAELARLKLLGGYTQPGGARPVDAPGHDAWTHPWAETLRGVGRPAPRASADPRVAPPPARQMRLRYVFMPDGTYRSVIVEG